MPNIFISYRRADSAASARDLNARLKNAFSDDEVFFDIHTIARGENFVDVVKKAVSASQVLLAVIGPKWADIKNKRGVWRLGQPEDLVRVEIVTALKCNIRVIPVLVDGASMPEPEALPPELSVVANLVAQEITHTRVDYDVGELIAAIGGEAAAPAAADPADDFWGTLASSLASKLGERLANVGARQPPPALPFGRGMAPAPPFVPPALPDLSGEWRATRTGTRHLMQQRGTEILDQTLNPFGMVTGEARGRLVGNQLFLAYQVAGPLGVVRGELRALVSPDGRLIQGSGFDSMMGSFPVELQRV
jgi:hypothetical protein